MRRTTGGPVGALAPSAKQLMVLRAGERTGEFRALVEPALHVAGLGPGTTSVWFQHRVDVHLPGGFRLRLGRLVEVGDKSSGWRIRLSGGAGQSYPWAPSWVDDTDGSPAALLELLRAVLVTVAIRG